MDLYALIRSRSKKLVQMLRFDCKCSLNAALFYPTLEAVLFGVLARFLSAFLAHGRLQTDG